MANSNHLEILKRGVNEWNQWREAYPDIKPDLDGANLYRKNFTGANLSGANLGEADLRKANLRGVLLRAATLSEADLSEADLGEADLSEADLIRANLNKTYILATRNASRPVASSPEMVEHRLEAQPPKRPGYLTQIADQIRIAWA